jgi:hypothetical protein
MRSRNKRLATTEKAASGKVGRTLNIEQCMTNYKLEAETGEYKFKCGRVRLGIRRGPESWQYIYIALGFAISIEGTIITMLPIERPFNLSTFIIFAVVTGWYFLNNKWLQNALIEFKGKIEDKIR